MHGAALTRGQSDQEWPGKRKLTFLNISISSSIRIQVLKSRWLTQKTIFKKTYSLLASLTTKPPLFSFILSKICYELRPNYIAVFNHKKAMARNDASINGEKKERDPNSGLIYEPPQTFSHYIKVSLFVWPSLSLFLPPRIG